MNKNLNSYLRSVEKSQTLLLNEQSRNLEQSGKTVYKLGFGQSPFLPPSHVVEALRQHATAKEYSPVQGMPALRQAVARFHSNLDKIDCTADDVLVAPGSKILIYAIMAAFTKADVFIPVPSWVSYIPQAQLLGHRVVKLETSKARQWRLEPEQLDQALKEKPDSNIPSILIINYPGNPDGLTYSREQLEALAKVAKRHNMLVISDEIYGLLNHQGAHYSLARFYQEGTIVTTGLSKWCGAGGWRLGVALLPRSINPALKEALLGVASETYSCAPTPVQLAAITAYEYSAEIERYLAEQRQILGTLGQTCSDRLNEAGIHAYAPKGGFYLFLDFMSFKKQLAALNIQTSDELCRALLAESGVAILPGTAFGMAPEYLSARLAYVDFNGTEALQAVTSGKPVDAQFLQSYCGKVLEGIDALCKANLLSGHSKRLSA